jgi:regulator of cell morphogenesis and NO signaling
MEKEEQVLFPFIKKMSAPKEKSEPTACSNPGALKNPIAVMEAEHESTAKMLAEIRTFTHNYTLPEDACASYSLLYRMLDEFENDLHIHVHLENNILFPKARTL